MMLYSGKKSNPIISFVLWTTPGMQRFVQLCHSLLFYCTIRPLGRPHSARSTQQSKEEQAWWTRQADVSFYL